MDVTPVTKTEPEWLNVHEVAKEVRVSAMSIYRLVYTGELPATQIGRSIRIRRADLDAYIDASKVSARKI